MSESNLEFKKADGKPIKFNFQLPNGLPYKEILSPNFKVVRSKTTKECAIYAYLTSKELEITKNIKIIGYNITKLEDDNFSIWLITEECYIVFENLNDKIINELNNKNLGFCFFNIEKTFVTGFKFD